MNIAPSHGTSCVPVPVERSMPMTAVKEEAGGRRQRAVRATGAEWERIARAADACGHGPVALRGRNCSAAGGSKGRRLILLVTSQAMRYRRAHVGSRRGYWRGFGVGGRGCRGLARRPRRRRRRASRGTLRSRHERERTRAEAAEARCEELRRSELDARCRAGSLKTQLDKCRGKLKAAEAETKEVRRTAQNALALQGRSDAAGEAPFASRRRDEQAQHDHVPAHGGRPSAQRCSGRRRPGRARLTGDRGTPRRRSRRCGRRTLG